MALSNTPPPGRSLPLQGSVLPPIIPRRGGQPVQPQGSLTGDLGLSWETGWEQMRGVPAYLKGVGASLLEKAGFEDAARAQRLSAYNLVTEMQNNLAELDALYVGPNSWAEAQKEGTIGSYAIWGINEAVKQVPNLAAMVLGTFATAGVGSLAFTGAKVGARLHIARMLSRMPGTGQTLAKGRAWGAGDDAFELMAGRGSAAVGTVLGSALLNTGEIYSSALLETGENNPAVTGLAGLLAGSLDMWPGSKIIRNMGKGQEFGSAIANKFLRDKKWRSRLYRSLELGTTEAVVEDWQTVIEAFTVNYLNDNLLASDYVAKAYGIVPITAEQVAGRMEARAAGALLGFGLGGFGRVGGRSLKRRKAEILAEDLRQIDEAVASVRPYVSVPPPPVTQTAEGEYVVTDTSELYPPKTPPTRTGSRTGGYPIYTPDDPAAVPIGALIRAGLPIETIDPKYKGLGEQALQQQQIDSAFNAGDPTTDAASAALGIPVDKPLTKAQLKREEKIAAKAISMANLDANLAGLPATPRGGFPIPNVVDGTVLPSVDIPAAPTPEAAAAPTPEDAAVTATLDMVTAVHVPNDSPQRSLQRDVETAAVAVLEFIRQNKAALAEAKSEADLKQYQKDLLLDSYLDIYKGKDFFDGDGNRIVVAKRKLKALLKDKGLIGQNITINELGLEGDFDRFALDAAIREFIGEEILADVSQEEAIVINYALREDKEFLETIRELNRLESLQSTLDVLEEALKLDPRLLNTPVNLLAASDLLSRYGIPQNAAIRGQLASRIETATVKKSEREAGLEEARRAALEKKLALKGLSDEEVGVVGRAAEERTKRRIGFETVEVDDTYPSYVEGERKPVSGRVTVREKRPSKKALGFPTEDEAKKAAAQQQVAKAVPTTDDEVGAVVVTPTTAEQVGEIPYPTQKEVVEYQESEVFWGLVWNAFGISDMGDNFVYPAGPEGPRGTVKKLLEKFLPDGEKRLYDLDYYEEQREYPDWGITTIAELKKEIAARTNRKVEDILAVSPAGTYVVRHKPLRKNIVVFKRDEQGNVTLDEDGNPEFEIREPKKNEVTQLPERLFLYDGSDQVIMEQFVDDERNFQLAAALDDLKKKHGVIKDIPISELSKLASRFSIRSNFVGVVRRKGRAAFITLEGMDVKEEPIVETWFRTPSDATQEDYISLGRLQARYRDILNVGATPDRAWTVSLARTIAELQEEAAVRFNDVETAYPDLSEKELKPLLKEADAYFTQGDIDTVTNFANKHREFLTDPENENVELPVPKGAAVDAGKIYHSLRNSVSQGRRASDPFGYDETQETFIARASTPPVTPREITKGTKVTLTPHIWSKVFGRKDSQVSKLTGKLWRLQVREERLGRGVLFRGEKRKADEKPLTTSDYEKLWVYKGMTDKQLFDKANEMGWLSHKYFGKLFPGKKTIDAEVMTAIRNVLDRVLTYKKIPRPTQAKPTKEEVAKASDIFDLQLIGMVEVLEQDTARLSKEETKKINEEKKQLKESIGEDRYAALAEIIKERKQIEAEIEETQLQIEKAIGEFLEKSYNVVGKKGDSYIVERGGEKLTIPKEYIVVQKFSEEGVRRIQINELYKIENKIRIQAKRGTYNIAPRRAKIENAFNSVDKEIEKETAKLEASKSAGRISDKNYVKRRDEIINSRVPRVYEAMAEMSHVGKPLIVLPSKGPSKDILASVKAGSISYQEGILRYVKRIKKAHKKEPRITKQARIRRQFREDEDVVLIRTLRTPDGKWLPAKGNEELIRSVGTSLKSSPIIVGGVVEGKLTPKAKKTVGIYPMIKDRFDQLRLILIERIPENLRPESFEGRAQSSAWAEGRYWEFVRSEDLAPEEATETMMRAVQDLMNLAFKRKRKTDRLPRIVGGKFLGATPVARWKNAYGVIIDKVVFYHLRQDAEYYDQYTIYEVNDPYNPDNAKQFARLEDAKKAYGKKSRYDSSRERVQFPVTANILKGRTAGKPAMPKGVDTKNPSKNTDDVLKEQDVKVTVVTKGKQSEITVTSFPAGVTLSDLTSLPYKRKSGPERKSLFPQKPTSILQALAKTQELIDLARADLVNLRAKRQTALIKKKIEKTSATISGYASKINELKREQIADAPSLRYSLVLESQESADGTVHAVLAGKEEGGSTVEEVTNTLIEAYGNQVLKYVTVVQSVDQLPVDVKLNREGYDSDIRAVSYSGRESSGITMVADNLPIDRVIPVALHEIGAHGFQSVMGKRFYQKMMKQVAFLVNTDSEIRAIYDRVTAEMDTKNEALLLEETMAYIVENEAMTNSPFWRVIVDAILYGLARLKLWLNPKKIGAADILVFAKAAARKHSYMAKEESAVYTANFLNTFLYSGEFGANTKDKTSAESRFVAAFRENVGPEMEMGFTGSWFLHDVPLVRKFIENFFIIRDIRRLPAIEGKKKLFGRYQVFVGHNFAKWFIDYFQILNHLEASIKRRGGDVNDKNMPSLFHGAYKNIVNVLRRSFHNSMVQPLADYMKLHDINGDDFHMYLYATHAPHRNKAKKEAALKKGLPNASGMWSTEEDAREGNIKWAKMAEEKGLVFEYQTSSEAELKILYNKLGKDKYGKLAQAAKFIYLINQTNLSRQLESGMITREIMAKSEMYSNPQAYATYVPLRGDNILVADEFFEAPIGPSKLGVHGPESKKASGRFSQAENTWAWSIMQMDYELDRIEKNKVVRSFAQLIKDNEENLKNFATVVSLAEFKAHEVADTGQLILGMHKNQQTDPDHNIHFKVNGEEFVILVKDKRIGQAFNRTNMTDSGVFLQLTSNVNRWFSAVHTSVNPEFVLTNFVRDFSTAMANLQGLKETVGEFKDTEALSRKVFKDIKSAGVGLKHFIRDKKTDTEWARLAEEFSLQGGRIDFFAFKDVGDFEKSLTDYIKDTTPAGARRWKNKMLDFVGEYNAVVENTMRLATYKNAKEAFIQNGMDEASAMRRAADISRNLTVNFSQKGEKGAALNSLYLFFNASVQGTVRLMQALFRRPTGKKGMTRVQKVAGGIMLYSFTQSILNSMLAGDDEDGINRWSQIDMRTRGRQLHIYMPGFDTFFKIPLPYGYNFFHAIGDTVASLMMGHSNPGRATMHLMSTAAESFMPFSFGTSDNLFKAGLQTAVPTFADPLLELALNENYFGQPIYKDPQWGSSDPPSERYWSSTGPIPKFISRSLNWLGGGSRAVEGSLLGIPTSYPPDIFEYFWETIGGGAARFVERSTDLVWTIGPGRLTHRETGEVKWTKVPFARRFFFDETASKKRFTYDKYSQYEKDIRTAVGMNTGILEIYGAGSKDYDNFKEGDDYKLFKMADYRKKIVGSITKLQKQRNKILSNKVLRDDVKEDRVNSLEDRMTELRIKLINKVDEDIFEK